MNAAHLHLMLVHLPVVLIPLGAILLAIGLWRANGVIKQVALSIFIAGALFAGLAFSFGEGAEEAVEHLAGIVESTIETHEESAFLALGLVIALGLLSLMSFVALNVGARKARLLLPLVLAVSVLSSATLGVTAQQGGQIRHPEAFETGPEGASKGHSEGTREVDDD